MMESFGRVFRISLFGQSHSACLGVEIEGVPAGVRVSLEDFLADIRRRKPGNMGTTARIEDDIPLIIRGIEEGETTGTSVRIVFGNTAWRADDYKAFNVIPRPGHADFVRMAKYGRDSLSSGGGMFSGRMTLPLVAAGVVAKKIIAPVKVSAVLTEAGGIPLSGPDPYKDGRFTTLLKRVVEEGDSIGGIVECTCVNMPVGIGNPFFDTLESMISHIVFSVPGIRGIEFGDGFRAAGMRGSEHNDPIVDVSGRTSKNGAGGINGGISNGNPLVFRVAAKPASSIGKSQETVNMSTGEMCRLSIGGRHDACFALRLPPVIESVAACAVCDLLLSERNL